MDCVRLHPQCAFLTGRSFLFGTKQPFLSVLAAAAAAVVVVKAAVRSETTLAVPAFVYYHNLHSG